MDKRLRDIFDNLLAIKYDSLNSYWLSYKVLKDSLPKYYFKKWYYKDFVFDLNHGVLYIYGKEEDNGQTY